MSHTGFLLAPAQQPCPSPTLNVTYKYISLCKAAHAEKLGASGIGILPNMFTVPNDTDHLVQWIKHVAGAAPNTPAIYYHIPICTKVTCKSMSIQGSTNRRAPGCVNAAGKLRQKW